MLIKKSPKNSVRLRRPILVTAALIFLIIGSSFAATGKISRKEEADAFRRLYEETDALAHQIELQQKNDQRHLQTIASVLSEYEDLSSPEIREILGSYASIGTMSRLELLLPGDIVIRPDGPALEAEGRLSFEEEAALGAHISDRETDLWQTGYILRHYVPVVQDGRTTAMLYGVVELNSLPEFFSGFAYGQQAAVYIIDGKTGDFLMDTWHKTEQPGNIWALGERPMAPGYDHELLKQGLIDGKTGYVVFVSNTTGEYLYFYYEPLSINSWRVALSVPEDIVFSDARAVEKILNILLLLEITSFLLYFFWVLRYVRRETGEKQRQLDTINNIYDVEKLLFNAHEHQENIIPALEKTASLASSQAVCFLLAAPEETPSVFLYRTDNSALPADRIEQIARILPEYFRKERTKGPVCDRACLQAAFPRLDLAAAGDLAAVMLRDTDGSFLGILAAFLMSAPETGISALKGAALSFSMLCRNMRSYNAIREKGEKDALCGLYNRNRYEQELSSYPGLFRRSLSCIYVDVNGLHELNNSQGHEAGDRMLRAVSSRLLSAFGSDHTYRIGGDEFLVFAIDQDEKDLRERVAQMRSALEAQGFYLSIGISRTDRNVSPQPSMDDLVRTAEHLMYQEKKAYYENSLRERRMSRRILK